MCVFAILHAPKYFLYLAMNQLDFKINCSAWFMHVPSTSVSRRLTHAYSTFLCLFNIGLVVACWRKILLILFSKALCLSQIPGKYSQLRARGSFALIHANEPMLF
jgi:hypothetical protein